MKIVFGKHNTIDWDGIKNELSEKAKAEIDAIIVLAQEQIDELEPGQSKTISGSVGKITLFPRKAGDRDA